MWTKIPRAIGLGKEKQNKRRVTVEKFSPWNGVPMFFLGGGALVFFLAGPLNPPLNPPCILLLVTY